MNKYRYIQSGRSMVEMLAVLAIIGILIIAGIVGYSYAMQLFREAETYDNISTTVAGGRTWPILDHYGKRTLKVDIDGNTSFTSYVIPIRDVVSKVKYKSAVTAEEAGIDNKSLSARQKYDARRELEAFDGKVMAPVWVRAEDNKAWSVRIVGLSQKMCKSLVSNRTLGYHKAYIALRDKNGAPVDPYFPDEDISAIPEEYGKDFKDDPRYTNQDMKETKNVNALCQTIDELNSPIPPVQQFLKVAKLSGMKDPTVDASGCDNPNTIACLARDAKVNGKHLQTLVLWWGEEDDLINLPDPTGCEAGTAFKIIDGRRVLDPECCKTELNGVWARLPSGETTCCQTGAVDLAEAIAVVNSVGGNAGKSCTQSPTCSINGANVTGRAIDSTGGFEKANSYRCCANCYNGADSSAFCCGITGQNAGCQAVPKNESGEVQAFDPNPGTDTPKITLCPTDIVACCGSGETAKSCGSNIRTKACCERFKGARWQGGICCTNWGGYYKGNKPLGYCRGIPGSRR